MPRVRRQPEPESDDPANMPAHLRRFDGAEWPLQPLVELDDPYAVAGAKRRRAWRLARSAWLSGHDYPDLATQERRTSSHEYGQAFRRAGAWRYPR